MKNKWSNSLTVIIVSVSLFLAMPVWVAGKAQAVDLTKKCTLTVIPGTQEELAEADVVIDLYKVADAIADSDYDTYGYKTTAPYEALSESLSAMEALDNESWQELAVKATDITLNQGSSIAKAVNGADADSVITGLDSGLYLLVARGADIAEYVTTDEEGKTVTIVNSDEYVYSFQPELISLPGTAEVLTGEIDENGNRQEINSAKGEWEYDLFAFLKPTQAFRFGTLEIVKTLAKYETADSATFVFRVDAYTDNAKSECIYSDVVSISFNSATQKSVLIENELPVGCYVEVTEVYSGAVYSLTTQPTQSAVIEANEVVSVAFTNSYNGKGNNGGAITNRFEYDAEKGWGWTPVTDEAAQ